MDYQFIKYAIEGTVAYGAIRAACLSDPYESDIGKTQEEEEAPDDLVHVEPLNPDYLITPVVNEPKEENELKQAFEDLREKKIDSITWNNQNYWEKLLTTGKNDYHTMINMDYCCESCEALGIICNHKRFIRPLWKTKSRQENLEAVFGKGLLDTLPRFNGWPINRKLNAVGFANLNYKLINEKKTPDKLRGSTADMVCVCFDCSIKRRVKTGFADPGYKLPPWNLIKDSYDESELLYKGESKIIILEEADIIPKELFESVVRPLLSSNLWMNKNPEYKSISDEKKAGDRVAVCPDSFASEIEMWGRLQKELSWGNNLDIQFQSATEYTVRNNNPDYKPEIGEDVFVVPTPFKGWPTDAGFHPVGFIDPDYKSKNGEDWISVVYPTGINDELFWELARERLENGKNKCWMCERDQYGRIDPDIFWRAHGGQFTPIIVSEPIMMQQLRDAINDIPKPIIKNERKNQPINLPKYPKINRNIKQKQKGYKRANNQRGMKKLSVRK